MPAKRTTTTPPAKPSDAVNQIVILDDGFLPVTIKDAEGNAHEVALDVLELNNAFAALSSEHENENDRASAWVNWLVEKKGLPKLSQGGAFKLLNVVITRAAEFYATVAPAPVPAAPAKPE